MCETNQFTANSGEQRRDTKEDEFYNEEQNGLVKFDIGEFVHNHRKVQLLLGPWIRLLDTLLNIIRWQSPYVSLFWMVLFCFIAVFSPIWFIVIPFFYVISIMCLSGIKKQGKQKSKTIQRTIKKKADNNDLIFKATVEKQVKEDVKDFITLLVQLEALTELLTKGLEDINRIIKWEDFKTSISVFLGMLFAIILLLLVPLSVNLVFVIVSVFCLNVGFKPVAVQVFSAFKKEIKSALSLLGLRELLFSAKTDRQMSASSMEEDKWYDAEVNGMPEQSSDEYDSDSYSQEDSSMNIKKLQDSSSILSQLADYRRKQKKLNSGKCRSCDVPFSSILKKRQYCRHCGESFCSKCCSHRVKRSVFGATAPAAYEETVLVCKPCFDLLMNVNAIDQPTGTAW